jgi:hypothetical protein
MKFCHLLVDYGVIITIRLGENHFIIDGELPDRTSIMQRSVSYDEFDLAVSRQILELNVSQIAHDLAGIRRDIIAEMYKEAQDLIKQEYDAS